VIAALGYDIARKSSGKAEYSYDFEQEARQAIAIVHKNAMVGFEPLITLFGSSPDRVGRLAYIESAK